MARGKRVLFVAEKRAAIQVVKDRLAKAGLGEVLLDLHGADIRRSEIVAQLQKGLEGIRNAQPVEMASDLDRLEGQRRTLNAHVQALHGPVNPWGLSPYQMMQMALELSDVPEPTLRFRGSVLQRLTADQINLLGDLLSEAGGRSLLFLKTANTPWVSARTITPELVGEVLETADELIPLITRYEDLVQSLALRLGLRRPTTLAEGSQLLGLAGRVETFKHSY